MPTTVRRGIHYDALSDDADGPAQFQILGQAIDADVIYVEGALASRGAATPTGKLHRASDSKQTSLSTTDGWIDLGVKPRGTTLPTSPTDGQEFCWLVDTSNGIAWNLKYYAASGHWHFLGGTPLFSEVAPATDEGTASTAYTTLATPGPAIVIPRAGDYFVAIGAGGSPAGSSQYGEMSYDIGVTPAVDADNVYVTSYTWLVSSHKRRKNGLAAVTLTAKYRASGLAGGVPAQFSRRYMEVTPIRIVG